jgi:hypothetical protein
MNPSVRTIIELNIKRFRELLETETDRTKRHTITRLLAEEEAKLARMEEYGDNSEEHRDLTSDIGRIGTDSNLSSTT